MRFGKRLVAEFGEFMCVAMDGLGEVQLQGIRELGFALMWILAQVGHA